jgi:branched-chain amino acid transport system substrate-binding protein
MIQDIIKHVIDNPNASTQTEKENVGHVLYNRAVFNGVLVAEGIRAAQAHFGKPGINAEEMRWGLENVDLSDARLKEIGLEGFTAPIKGSCADHENGGSIFMHQWNGTDFDKVTDLIPPMTDIVRPMLETAAAKYIEDKPDWQKQTCN